MVIRVVMVDQKKSRKKAMKIAATAFGTFMFAVAEPEFKMIRN